MIENQRGNIQLYFLQQYLNSYCIRLTMLSTEPFTLPFLQSMPLIDTISNKKSSTRTSNSSMHDRQNLNSIPTSQSVYKKNSAGITRSLKVVLHNNMYEEINWFNTKNVYEVLLKVLLLWTILLFAFSLGFYTGSTFVLLGIFSSLLLGLNHNVFGEGPYWCWVKISLFMSTLLLANQIIIPVINYIKPSVAEILYFNYFTLIPSALVAFMLSLLYVNKDLILNNECRTFHQCLTNYRVSFKEMFVNLYHMRWICLQIYFLSFLVGYAIIAYFFNRQIQINGRSYYSLLDLSVFVAQVIAFFTIILYTHLLIFCISGPIFWKSLPIFFGNVNPYTKIPILMQLLKATSSEQVDKEMNNKGLLASFKIFSLQKSRRQNNLNREKYEHIIKHSLAWVIKSLNNKSDKLSNKISLYSTVSSTQINETKGTLTYWDMLSQFFVEELQRMLLKMHNFQNCVAELKILRQKQKSILQDLFCEVKVIMKQAKIWLLAIELANFLKIADYILQILSTRDVNLDQSTGKSTLILLKIEELSQLSDRLQGVFWLNQVIIQKIKRLFNKTNRLIKKSRK